MVSMKLVYLVWSSIRAVTLRAFTSCHIWELKVKDIVPLFAPYPHLKEDLIEGYRLRMVQRLNRNSLGASALEGNVEAELGLDMTTSDAVLFKTQLGLVRKLPNLLSSIVLLNYLTNMNHCLWRGFLKASSNFAKSLFIQ